MIQSLSWALLATIAGANPSIRVSLQPGSLDIVEGLHLDEARRREHVEAGQHVVTLLDRTTVEFGTRNRIATRRRVVRQFLSDEGVREWANFRVYADAKRETTTINLAFVVTPDASIVDVDPSTIQVQSDSHGHLFTDDVVITIPAAAVEPGAFAVFEYSRLENSGRWPFPWSSLFFPQWFLPTERFELKARWQDGAFSPSITTDAEELECSKPDVSSVVCSAAHIAPIPYDSDVRSFYDRVPSIVVSEAHTWKQLAARGARLLKQSSRPTPAVRRLAARLQRGAADKRQIVERLYRFVASEIRYVAIEHGVGAVKPRPATLTLNRRYGDCKDKVALFVALARAAELDAYGVLVSSFRFDSDRLVAPSWKHFDHMIACVDLPADGAVCLELTTPNAAAGVLPPGLRGAMALSLRRDASAPHPLPIPTFGFESQISVQNHLNCKGDIVERTKRRYLGAAAMSLRAVLRGMTETERSRWLRSQYRTAMGNDAAPNARVLGLEKPDEALVIESEYTYPGGTPAAEVTEFNDKSFWLTYHVGSQRSDNEHHPYDFGGVRIKSRVEYSFCNSVRSRFLGPALELEADLGHFRRSYERDGEKVIVDSEFEAKNRLVAHTELERFNRFIDVTLQQSAVWIGLQATDDAAKTPSSTPEATPPNRAPLQTPSDADQALRAKPGYSRLNENGGSATGATR